MSGAGQETFLLLHGVLCENMEFEAGQCYETRAAARALAGRCESEGLRAELLDDSGVALVTVFPEVRFPTGCGSNFAPIGFGELSVAIPRHPQGRAVVLRSEERVLYEAPVGTQRPAVEQLETTLSESGSELRATWRVGDVDSLALSLVLSSGREFPVVAATEGDDHLVDVAAYAGRGEARLRLRATRRFRTGEALSPAFRLPPDTVEGRILEPSAGLELDAGRDISLIGNLSGGSGAALAWDRDRAAWVLDGQMLASTRQIAGCPPLSSGTHLVQLQYEDPQKGRVILDEVSFGVREPTEAQLDYEAQLEGYLAARKKASKEASSCGSSRSRELVRSDGSALPRCKGHVDLEATPRSRLENSCFSQCGLPSETHGSRDSP